MYFSPSRAMKTYVLSLLGLMLMLMNSLAQAQVHPCSGPSQNEVVVGQTEASNGIASVPLCRTTNGGDSPHSAAPVLHWESRWGAIATDAPHGIISPIKDQLSRGDAERASLSDCKAKGGVDCKLQVSYSNGCGALAYSGNTFAVEDGSTAEEASKKAIRSCSSSGKTCEVYVTSCSPAALVH
jgi:hypothetical protein